MQASLCRTSNRPDRLDHGVGDHRHPHRAPPGLRYERLFPRWVLTNFSELIMLFEIANKNQFPFPVQSNAPVGLIKHPTISRFFLTFFSLYFSGVSEHPVLLQQIPEWKNGQDSMFGFSMAQFEQLILNKTFLLTLVDTVEQQPGFGIRDRVNTRNI